MRLVLTMLLWTCAALLPAQAQAQADGTERLPLSVWSQLDAARAIQPHGNQPQLQIIFDPYCPASARLFQTLRAQYPHASVRWVPIAYYRPQSGQAAARILAARDPRQALAEQFEALDQPVAPTGRRRAGREERINPDIHQSTLAWGGYTPMILSRDAAGNVRVHRHHYTQAIELALGRPAR